MLPKHRYRDLQAIDQLGAGRTSEGEFTIGGQPVRSFNSHGCGGADLTGLHIEWLWAAGYLEQVGEQLVLTDKAERVLVNPVEREWLYSVRPVVPKTHLQGRPRNPDDVYLHSRHFGFPSPQPDGDDELYLEEVARFAAVARHVDNDRIWLDRDGVITNLVTGEEYTGDRRALFPWGMRTRQQEAFYPVAADRSADSYFRKPVFLRHAGRKVKVVDASYQSLVSAIHEVAGDSGKVVVKVARPKYGITTLDVTGGVEAAVDGDELLMGALVHLEGDWEAFIVQEHVEMTFERRFFVVGKIALTSAGCIEEYTPFERIGQHDPRMRRHRSDEDIIWATEQTKRLDDFASRIARKVQWTPGDLTEYVLDVAFGPDGEPLIVEFNSIRNAGLYATSPDTVVRNLTARPDVWGKAPHARPRVTAAAVDCA